jgi:hypothetical protein
VPHESGSTFYGLRLDTLFDNILLDAAAGGTRYGFVNVTTPCLTPVVSSCAGALFADALHPATTVPEPTTIALVAGGLLMLTGLRRRSQRR